MYTLKILITLLTAKEKKTGAGLLLVLVGMALLDVAGIASIMPFLALLGNPDLVNTNSILSALFDYSKGIGLDTNTKFFMLIGLLIFLLIVISLIYRTYSHFLMNKYVELQRHNFATRLLEAYLKQPYTFFLHKHSSDMTKTLLSEVDQVIATVFRPSFQMLAYIPVIISIIGMLLLVDPVLTVVAALLYSVLYTSCFEIIKKKLQILGETVLSTNKKRFKASSEVFGGIKDIKLLGREKIYLNLFRNSSNKFAASMASQQTVKQIPNYLVEGIIFGSLLLLTIILISQNDEDGGTILIDILPKLGVFALAAYRMKVSMVIVFNGLASLRFGCALVKNLSKELKDVTPSKGLVVQHAKKLKISNKITLKKVSYSYPSSEKPAISGFDLEISVGSTIGFVGSTGAGKTTLIDILLGLLKPSNGTISVDDVLIDDNNITGWQKSIGYVPQEIFLTDATILENIALGIPRDEIDYAKVERAAVMAQVHDFINEELTHRYETVVGERGVRLSGGQRQRIGIARALYRNPEVLVFDEATSALDNATEKYVMEAVSNLSGHKTIIIIAHRLSTVEKCDLIVFLEKGKMKAVGKFDELIKNCKEFRNLAGIN